MKPTSTLNCSHFRGLIHALLAALAAASLPFTGFAQAPGALDANFDGDGIATAPFATGDAAGYSMTLHSSGDIMIAGWLEGSTDMIAAARMNQGGSLVSSFDGDGKILGDFGETHGRAYSIARYFGDDFIVVGESRSSGADSDFGIARYDETGQLVAGFGNGGVVTTDFVGNTDDRAWSVAIQPDGRILVAGWTTGTDGRTDMAVARYLSNGNLDNSFSSNGKATFDPSQLGYGQIARKVLIQPDGKILLIGEGLETVFDAKPLVVRIDQNGSLDPSFNGSGFGYFWPAASGLECWDAALHPDGRIILVGRTEAVDPFLTTITSDGIFNGNANLGAGPFALDAMFYAVTTQEDGKIVCAGYSSNGGGNSDVMVACFNSDLSPDADFSSDGFVFTGFEPTGFDVARDILIQADGRILVGGYATSANGKYFALARYHPHLTLGILDLTIQQAGLEIYPNPIAASATLTYTLAEAEELTIALHDQQGRLLATYLNAKELPPGEHSQTIGMPEDLASGNYLLVLSSAKGKMSIQVTKAP